MSVNYCITDLPSIVDDNTTITIAYSLEEVHNRINMADKLCVVYICSLVDFTDYKWEIRTTNQITHAEVILLRYNSLYYEYATKDSETAMYISMAHNARVVERCTNM